MYSFSIFPISALDVEDLVCFLEKKIHIYIYIICKKYKGDSSDFAHGNSDCIQSGFAN